MYFWHSTEIALNSQTSHLRTFASDLDLGSSVGAGDCKSFSEQRIRSWRDIHSLKEICYRTVSIICNASPKCPHTKNKVPFLLRFASPIVVDRVERVAGFNVGPVVDENMLGGEEVAGAFADLCATKIGTWWRYPRGYLSTCVQGVPQGQSAVYSFATTGFVKHLASSVSITAEIKDSLFRSKSAKMG